MLRAYVEASAVVCGSYRHLLRRVWRSAGPTVCLIMLNPSKADAADDDPTIKSCVRLFDRLGFGGFEVVNLFAWVATEPAAMPRLEMAKGADNDRAIREAVGRCDVVVCAWGGWGDSGEVVPRRVSAVFSIIARRRRVAYCFGTTKRGAPLHPLYLKTGTQLEVFRRWP